MNDDRREDRNGAEPDSGWLDRLMHRFNLRPRDSMRDDLAEVLAEATAAADLSEHERTMLGNVLAFHRVRVGDVMVPRSDIVAAAAASTLGAVLGLFRIVGHSRLPVYGASLDEPLGMVHIRDVMNHVTGQGTLLATEPGEPATVLDFGAVDLSGTLAGADLLRPLLFVPGSMPAIDLLARMQASRIHIALVIDEYGGTDGLVSMEDLVETVVGDIEDEHDIQSDLILREDEASFLVDARAELDDVSAALGRDLTGGIDASGVDTLGGWVVTLAGRVPSRGERFAGPDGLEFEVVEADRRRLKRIRIRDAAVPLGGGTASDDRIRLDGAG